MRKKKEIAVVYIGPTIKHKLKKNTVFANGIPEIGKEIEKDIPAIKSLFVPLKDIADAKKEVDTKDSALNLIYKKVEGVI